MNPAPNFFLDTIPLQEPEDILSWAEENVRIIGSARTQTFSRTTAPWIVYPILLQFDIPTKITTFIKPVQCGGSTAGAVVACGWAKWRQGFIQKNWEDDKKAENKWQEVDEPILKACRDLDWRGERFDSTICRAEFARGFIRSQGVWSAKRLDSDSVPLQINEEIHSWKPGFLAKARARQSAIWNPKALDISNAGHARPSENRGDAGESFQLHDAFMDGTQQHWEVFCPGCNTFHVMRTRWEDSHPHLGGLRYDSVGCKRDNGTFDYNKLAGTIRYEMPCGYIVHDDVRERRALSLGGRYGAPQNDGANVSHRSLTLEAVSVDFISWIDLIREKHIALRADRSGDREPWFRYLTERESHFYSDESRPFQGQILTNKSLKKSREGLPGRIARFWAADRQKGYKARGEMPHYWLAIRDVMPNGDSQLVFEGMVQTESDLVAQLDAHGCLRHTGGVDATWDRDNILAFCYRSGCHAFTGSAQREYFFHKRERAYRIASEPVGLHTLLNVPPKFNYMMQRGDGNNVEYVPGPQEPRHWHYHKIGILKLLFFLRDHRQIVERNNGGKAEEGSYIKWEVPGDVSEDYKNQLESWECVTISRGASDQQVEQWKQIKLADHLLMCEGYIAELIAKSGILGARLASMGITDTLLGANKTEDKNDDHKN